MSTIRPSIVATPRSASAETTRSAQAFSSAVVLNTSLIGPT